MPEQFVDIPEAPGYKVGNGGTIVRAAGGQGTKAGPIKPTANKGGYYTVSLRVKGKTVTRYVHDLVGRAFCKGYKKGCAVNHRDRNRANNGVQNLEFMDAKDNAGHGRLTKAGVAKIKLLAKKGRKPAQIAKLLNIRPGVVNAVLRNGA